MRYRLCIFLLGATVALALAGCTGGGASGDGHGRSAQSGASAGEKARDGEPSDEVEEEERPNGYAEPRKEAKFEGATGEADRKGPNNPAAEQVDNRAYPRSYVDDKRSIGARAAYQGRGHQASRADFDQTSPFAQAVSATPGAWQALGPVTPVVPSEASQFWDPRTQKGPATQESGRVTALAIDPNCGKSSAPAGAPCRLWVAAAGGGICRTNKLWRRSRNGSPHRATFPTNAFGSLIVDPNDATGNTLYAGSGEPNGSGDSEAGLGLFKSTNGGQTRGRWCRARGRWRSTVQSVRSRFGRGSRRQS